MRITDLPTLNAILNLSGTILLVAGYINIKKGRQQNHKKLMIAALVASVCFLISYVIYHYQVPSKPYPYFDWTRILYFIILIPHILLAAFMAPFILLALWFALKEKFDKHKKIVKWIWPVWMYVSVSGVIIYIMLYKI